MSTIPLTVTEFSRGLSNFLNQVQYQGQTLDKQRGKKLVARVLPAGARPATQPLRAAVHGRRFGAHDALIAATAMHYGHALLTRNVSDFTIFAGLKLMG